MQLSRKTKDVIIIEDTRPTSGEYQTSNENNTLLLKFEKTLMGKNKSFKQNSITCKLQDFTSISNTSTSLDCRNWHGDAVTNDSRVK